MGSDKTLLFASYGLEPKHITLETLAALKKCGVVFSHCLDGGKGDFIAKACPNFKSLRGLSIEKTAARVKAAFSACDLVGFLTYGNPFFLNATAVLVKRAAEAAGIKVKVLPAVSSFDAIVNLMDLNEFSRAGLRLVDASAAAAKADGLTFTPEMDTLFFVLGDLDFSSGRGAGAAFLKGLGAAYPKDHPVSIINCPTIEDAEGRLVTAAVSRLKTAILKADKVSTILVPAVRGKA